MIRSHIKSQKEVISNSGLISKKLSSLSKDLKTLLRENHYKGIGSVCIAFSNAGRNGRDFLVSARELTATHSQRQKYNTQLFKCKTSIHKHILNHVWHSEQFSIIMRIVTSLICCMMNQNRWPLITLLSRQWVTQFLCVFWSVVKSNTTQNWVMLLNLKVFLITVTTCHADVWHSTHISLQKEQRHFFLLWVGR